jgi:hypothetical protein
MEIDFERFAACRTQKEAAGLYARMLVTDAPVDWIRINAVIENRWSRGGLKRVKRQAWALANEAR